MEMRLKDSLTGRWEPAECICRMNDWEEKSINVVRCNACGRELKIKGWFILTSNNECSLTIAA